MYGTAEQRFWAKVDRTEGCWLWTASKVDGYGSFGVRQDDGSWVVVRAHRFAYELMVGPIPHGLTLDHLCRVRHCVNPAHLEPVPKRINTLRGESPAAKSARSTHCPNGHEYTAATTYLGGGYRQCRPCMTDRARRWRGRRAAS